MKLRIPVILQDPTVSGGAPVELTLSGVEVSDGPASPSLEVVDHDPTSGEALAPLGLVSAGGRVHRYDDRNDAENIFRLSVFGTVLGIVRAFEGDDMLDAPLRWAPGIERLRLRPRAFQEGNAYYRRDKGEIALGWVPDPDRPVYTALSHDIVAHEAGHAILDALAPDLADGLHPQCLGIHEAVADMVALISAMEHEHLQQVLLDQGQYDLRRANLLSEIGEQLARTRFGRGAVRSMVNRASLWPDAPDRASRTAPHDLSRVLTGALYDFLGEDLQRWTEAQYGAADATGAAGEHNQRAALAACGRQLRRFVLRALPYLPPGELSFADFTRTLIAVDHAIHPYHWAERLRLEENLYSRRALHPRHSLGTPLDTPSWAADDCTPLAEDPAAAEAFIQANARWLGLKDGARLVHQGRRTRVDWVMPHDRFDGLRLDASGNPLRPVRTEVDEVVLKVAWRCELPSSLPDLWPPRATFDQGLTLALDRKTGAPRLCVRGAAPTALDTLDRQNKLRDWVDLGLLPKSEGGDDLRWVNDQGSLRVQQSALTLHALPDRSA